MCATTQHRALTQAGSTGSERKFIIKSEVPKAMRRTVEYDDRTQTVRVEPKEPPMPSWYEVSDMERDPWRYISNDRMTYDGRREEERIEIDGTEITNVKGYTVYYNYGIVREARWRPVRTFHLKDLVETQWQRDFLAVENRIYDTFYEVSELVPKLIRAQHRLGGQDAEFEKPRWILESSYRGYGKTVTDPMRNAIYEIDHELHGKRIAPCPEEVTKRAESFLQDLRRLRGSIAKEYFGAKSEIAGSIGYGHFTMDDGWPHSYKRDSSKIEDKIKQLTATVKQGLGEERIIELAGILQDLGYVVDRSATKDGLQLNWSMDVPEHKLTFFEWARNLFSELKYVPVKAHRIEGSFSAKIQ
jgi:hypothetical protein